MSITLNPCDLQAIIDQIVAALAPTFQKRVEATAKASGEALYCLTVEGVAKRLERDVKTVLKYIREGKMRAANIGTREKPQYRVSEADFAEFYRLHRK